MPLGNTEEDDELRLLRGQIESALAGEIASGDVAVRNTGDGLVISLREVGFFDSGSDEIKASSANAFARLTAVLQQANSDIWRQLRGKVKLAPDGLAMAVQE